MASIYINNLGSTGSDLFTDAESYLQDLSEVELNAQGGLISSSFSLITITVTVTVTM